MALKEYIKTYYSKYISVFGSISFLAIMFPTLVKFIRLINYIIILVIIVVVVIHFLHWKKNNFYTTKIVPNNFIIIECEDNNYLIGISKYLIVPPEHSLNVHITLKFDKYVRSDLSEKGCYILIFKKPNNLEIESKNNVGKKFNPIVVAEGIDNPFYCIKIDYKNTNEDNLLFNLQADENINSKLEIYFLIGDNSFEKDFNKLISNKKPNFSEDIIWA